MTDLTRYNAVQRLLYIGIIFVIILQVLSGLVIWKPVQFSELAYLFYSFQGARLVHFLGMVAIVGFPAGACGPGADRSEDTDRHADRRSERAACAAASHLRLRRQRRSRPEEATTYAAPFAFASSFRQAIDQSVLRENRALIRSIDRRKFCAVGSVLVRSPCSLAAM